jgi:hypothetical protein
VEWCAGASVSGPTIKARRGWSEQAPPLAAGDRSPRGGHRQGVRRVCGRGTARRARALERA